MKILFSPRENGACPFCAKLSSCGIRRSLAESVADIPDPKSYGMEVVIFACPQFVEKF